MGLSPPREQKQLQVRGRSTQTPVRLPVHKRGVYRWERPLGRLSVFWRCLKAAVQGHVFCGGGPRASSASSVAEPQALSLCICQRVPLPVLGSVSVRGGCNEPPGFGGTRSLKTQVDIEQVSEATGPLTCSPLTRVHWNHPHWGTLLFFLAAFLVYRCFIIQENDGHSFWGKREKHLRKLPSQG